MNTYFDGFVTEIDTKKLFVTIKTKFVLRNYINSQGLSPLYIFISSPGTRERFKTELEFRKKDWDADKERLKANAQNSESNNLILENIISKITKIKTTYLLSEKELTAPKLVEELKNTTNHGDFIIFFRKQLASERKLMSNGYYKRAKAVLSKLAKYKDELYFSDINSGFEKKYRIYLSELGNASTTINSNLATIKKFLITAYKCGIKFPLDPYSIKIGNTNGNRIDLNQKELKRLHEYYESNFIPAHWKLILGYFLFSCFTGLRWSNVINLKREEILNNSYINFYVSKSNKRQSLSINKTAKRIVENEPTLFIKFPTDVHTNREIKKIANHLGISKKISFHVARHTFATNFIRMGGNVVKLKTILGHSNIRETMIYVHMVEQEANEDMMLMDKLYYGS